MADFGRTVSCGNVHNEIIAETVVHNLTKQKREKILILTLLSFFGCKNEPICTVNENNAGKEIYDLDEATCFIALKLNKKKSDLKLASCQRG